MAPLALGTAAAVIGVLVLTAELGELRDGVAAADWPSVPAVVTVARHSHSGKRFEYEYRVEGATYTSGRAGFAQSSFHQEYRLHDAGDTIAIRYDPDDPRNATVRPGVTVAGAIEGIGLSLMPLAFAAFLFFAALSRD